jgi:UPF0755 protein
VLIIVAVLAVVAFLGYNKGVSFLKEHLTSSPAADYSGSGQKPPVTITVPKGASGREIGGILFDAGVVKSVDAFTSEYEKEPRATQISYGKYKLLSKMSARSALLVMINPRSLIKNPTVTIPEGLRASEILASIASQTNFSSKQLQSAYHHTQALGLPAYAKGNPEGYLFPSTYDITGQTTPASLLHDMVAKFNAEATSLGLVNKAKHLGQSPGDIVTVASLVQAESGAADMRKVASVVYNRLDAKMPLQFDSTVHYALKIRGDVTLSDQQRQLNSPYNTYLVPGLTPTPIDAPGEEALKAALVPAHTNYLYFVTVNLATGKTKFASTLAKHNKNVEQYRQYCTTSDAC